MVTENGLAVKLVREDVLAYFRSLNQFDYIGRPSDRNVCPLMQYLQSLNLYAKGSFSIDYNHIIHSNGDLEIIPTWAREFVEHMVDLEFKSLVGLKVKDVVGVLDGTIVVEEPTFTFDELPEKIQQEIYQDYIEGVELYGWADDIIRDMEMELENELQGGDIEILYSGFYSQGDGASFTGKIHIETFISDVLGETEEYPLIMYVIKNDDLYDDYVSVYRTNHNYYHERSVKVNEISYCGDATNIEHYLEEETDKLKNTMQEWVEDRCRTIFDSLQKEYEYLTSFESFRENDIDSDKLYYIDGTEVD